MDARSRIDIRGCGRGESYLGAVPAFRILLLSLIPIGASNILGGQVLVPSEKEK